MLCMLDGLSLPTLQGTISVGFEQARTETVDSQLMLKTLAIQCSLFC